eukprot:6176814-Pleurochrysis_carterae.AAC.1
MPVLAAPRCMCPCVRQPCGVWKRICARPISPSIHVVRHALSQTGKGCKLACQIVTPNIALALLHRWRRLCCAVL